jgi:iron complex transport system substrate-binding protein
MTLSKQSSLLMNKSTSLHGLYFFISIALFLFLPQLSYATSYGDSLGRDITLPSPPVRIISLAPSITEMIYFLGLENRLVGVTRFSYYPEEARKKPKVGVYTNINIEKVITLNPDLVIATADGNRKEDVETLEEAGIRVYVINPRTVGQVLDTLERLGDIFGIKDRAKDLVSGLRERISKIKRRVKNREKPAVLLLINVKPIMGVNRHTIHDDLIRLAGGKNLTGDYYINYPKLNIEDIIRKKPDVIIISSMERGGEFERARKEWFKWTALPAAQKGHIYLIDSDLIDRAAPRIVNGLEEMAKLIHPEINWDDQR